MYPSSDIDMSSTDADTPPLPPVVGGLVHLNDRALERSDLDQPEAGRGREVREQGLAVGDGDRMGDQPILVDQPEPGERLGSLPRLPPSIARTRTHARDDRLEGTHAPRYGDRGGAWRAGRGRAGYLPLSRARARARGTTESVTGS
jgi:hypothetical protein